MSDKTEIIAGGIKCDNTECDYKDDTVKMEDWGSYVNKPCPKCGENLFTEEDYNKTQAILSIVKLVDSMSDEEKNAYYEMLGIDPNDEALNEMVTVRIDTHNNSIDIIDEETDEETDEH